MIYLVIGAWGMISLISGLLAYALTQIGDLKEKLGDLEHYRG